MITIPNKYLEADKIELSDILLATTKAYMLRTCKKFDLYVSPNVSNGKTAIRIAEEIIGNPIEIVSRLSKSDLQIIDEFAKGDDSTYVVRKIRKRPYILQTYYMVVTYIDWNNQEWHMLMPSNLRKAFSECYKLYLDLAEKGQKGPTAKDLRMMAAISYIRNISATGGIPVPADEDGKGAVAKDKYQL